MHVLPAVHVPQHTNSRAVTVLHPCRSISTLVNTKRTLPPTVTPTARQLHVSKSSTSFILHLARTGGVRIGVARSRFKYCYNCMIIIPWYATMCLLHVQIGGEGTILGNTKIYLCADHAQLNTTAIPYIPMSSLVAQHADMHASHACRPCVKRRPSRSSRHLTPTIHPLGF